MPPLLKRNLDPRDFLDSECRVGDWYQPQGETWRVRVWICRSGMFWFQRHEWLYAGENMSRMDDWIQTPLRGFRGKYYPAPEEDE